MGKGKQALSRSHLLPPLGLALTSVGLVAFDAYPERYPDLQAWAVYGGRILLICAAGWAAGAIIDWQLRAPT